MTSLKLSAVFIGLLVFSCITAHADSDTKRNNFLVISDIHLDLASKRIMEISPSGGNKDNDLDAATFEKLLRGLDDNIRSGIVSKPNFILVLGDIVGHHRTRREDVTNAETMVFSKLKSNFPTTPILYVFGNNDSIVINNGAFNDAASSTSLRSPNDVATTAAGWRQGFLSTGLNCDAQVDQYPCLLNSDATHGYYAAYVQPGLRLIGLNSIMLSRKRKGITEQEAADELGWVAQQLETAKQNGESVLMAMHVPFGNNTLDHTPFWEKTAEDRFLTMVQTYQSTIIGMLASHTHEEEMKVVKDNAGKNIAGLFLVAGLSTSHGNEPSAKSFYLDKKDQTWLLSNYETLHFSSDGNNLTFNKLYDYRSYYCGPNDGIGLYACLDNISAEKVKKYFTAGNKKYGGEINSPADFVVTVP